MTDFHYSHCEHRRAELDNARTLNIILESEQVQMIRAVCQELKMSYHDIAEVAFKNFILDNTAKLSSQLQTEIEKDDIIKSFYNLPSGRTNIAPVDPNKMGFIRWLSECWHGEESQDINPDHFNS